MSKEELFEKLTQAVVDIDEDDAAELVDEAIAAGISPIEILTEGLQPGLTIIGDGFEQHTRFTVDLVMAGDIMRDAMSKLRPIMEAGATGKGDTMILGTVEGDEHYLGKQVVGAIFTGAGYIVVDIGENQPANAFVDAAKEYNAKIVGASAILGAQKPYCKVIHEALTEAGMRDNLLYIVGGWGMTQEWCDRVCADAYGDTAYEAIDKVRLILAGELPNWKARLK